MSKERIEFNRNSKLEKVLFYGSGVLLTLSLPSFATLQLLRENFLGIDQSTKKVVAITEYSIFAAAIIGTAMLFTGLAISIYNNRQRRMRIKEIAELREREKQNQ